MPNIKSTIKRMRQNEKIRLRNRAARSVVRNRIKKLIRTLKAGEIAEAEVQFPKVCSALDSAASNRLWHPNTASRKKSRLSKLILKTKQAQKA
ncbi:MAG: 30S ribosomal protein S20 [Thermoguttaceae bacterium]|nr:30S ribosomal protein S20 [Thermoguttaceae bacterium]